MLYAWLRTRLVSEAPSVEGRVFATLAPQGAGYPRLTYQRVSDPRLYSHEGDTKLVEARVQVDAWGLRYADAHAAATEALEALSGYKGEAGDDEIASIFSVGGPDGFEAEQRPEAGPGVHRHRRDFIVRYKEG